MDHSLNPSHNVGGSRISNLISGRASQAAEILTADDADLRRYEIQTGMPQSKGVWSEPLIIRALSLIRIGSAKSAVKIRGLGLVAALPRRVDP